MAASRRREGRRSRARHLEHPEPAGGALLRDGRERRGRPGAGGVAAPRWCSPTTGWRRGSVPDDAFLAARRRSPGQAAVGAGGVTYLPWLFEPDPVAPAPEDRARRVRRSGSSDEPARSMARAVYTRASRFRTRRGCSTPFSALTGVAYREITAFRGQAAPARPPWGGILAGALGITVHRLAEPGSTTRCVLLALGVLGRRRRSRRQRMCGSADTSLIAKAGSLLRVCCVSASPSPHAATRGWSAPVHVTERSTPSRGYVLPAVGFQRPASRHVFHAGGPEERRRAERVVHGSVWGTGVGQSVPWIHQATTYARDDGLFESHRCPVGSSRDGSHSRQRFGHGARAQLVQALSRRLCRTLRRGRRSSTDASEIVEVTSHFSEPAQGH